MCRDVLTVTVWEPRVFLSWFLATIILRCVVSLFLLLLDETRRDETRRTGLPASTSTAIGDGEEGRSVDGVG